MLLLARLRYVRGMQVATIQLARQMKSVAPAYVLSYEAMQLDIGGEIRRLLVAIGVGEHVARERVEMAQARGRLSLSKSLRTETLSSILGNYDQLEALLRPAAASSPNTTNRVPSLHKMLVATEPQVFPILDPRVELDSLLPPSMAEMAENSGGFQMRIEPRNCIATARDPRSTMVTSLRNATGGARQDASSAIATVPLSNISTLAAHIQAAANHLTEAAHHLSFIAAAVT